MFSSVRMFTNVAISIYIFPITHLSLAVINTHSITPDLLMADLYNIQCYGNYIQYKFLNIVLDEELDTSSADPITSGSGHVICNINSDGLQLNKSTSDTGQNTKHKYGHKQQDILCFCFPIM